VQYLRKQKQLWSSFCTTRWPRHRSAPRTHRHQEYFQAPAKNALQESVEMSEELIGTRKGDYEILGVLGAGGMGKVYKVRNVLSDRIEAMKVLLPNLTDQKDLVERFLREIKVLAGLSHPNIAGLRTALTIDNQLVMIMEYVEGTTLGSRIERGPIPCGEALNYIDQVLSALSYAHERQIIHRDIKPSNMMLTPEGVVKLMDFGIARSGPDLGLTMTGMTLGSLAYMSPEQVKCEAIDARSDLYSVGVSLYEMVTGQRPFKADSNFAIMQAHLKEVPRQPVELKPDLPVAVSKIIVMAMEKEPAQRFQSAEAFRNALRSVAGELGVTLQPAGRAPTIAATPGPGIVQRVAPTIPATGVVGSPAAPASYAAVPMPPPQTSSGGHRGRYITLGALIVVVALVAAGLTLPRYFGTRANQDTSSQSKSSLPPQSDATAKPNPPPTDDHSTTSAKPAEPAKSPDAKNKSAAKADKKDAPEAAPPAPAGPDPAEVAEVEQQFDQLSGREAALNSSLDSLQQQQNAQGLQLRGDMVEARANVQTNLNRAQVAVQAQDVEKARKYLRQAEANIEKLEKFLGR
jgi:serine/threonine protein kinase